MIPSAPIVHRVQQQALLDESDCDFRDGLVYPPAAGTHPKGVSFFIPANKEVSEAIHNSFYVPRKHGCKLCDLAELPPGLNFKLDRPLKRNLDDPRRENFTCGQHVSVFPAEIMQWSDFQTMVLEFIDSSGTCMEKKKPSPQAARQPSADSGGGAGRGRGFDAGRNDTGGDSGAGRGNMATGKAKTCSATSEEDVPAVDHCGEEFLSVEINRSLGEVLLPGRTADAILQEAANVLYEMAVNPLTDPNRAFRALYFHYLLCEDDGAREDLYCGDALTSYLQEALDSCEDAPTMDSEDRRDYIRLTIAEQQLPWEPKVRSHDSGVDTLRAFGDNPFGVSTAQDEVQNVIPTFTLMDFLVRLIAAGKVDDFKSRMNNGYISQDYWTLLPSVDLDSVNSTVLDKVDLLAGASRIEIRARSVAIVADELPSSDARELKNWMNSCRDDANLLLMAAAFVSGNMKCGRNCEILRADTDGALMRSQAKYFRGVADASVWTSKLQAKALKITGISGESRVKAFASALSKCINNFYSHTWDSDGRVLVMCASNRLSIDLMKVPDPTKEQEYRNHVVVCLISSLSDDYLLAPYVNTTAAQLGPVPLTDNSQVLVLFSFGGVHQSACDLTYKVLRQKDMSCVEIADICVDVGRL